jgi:hypothetical protein
VSFTLGPPDYALPGSDLSPIVEPGIFTVGVGTSSAQLQQTRFELVP